MSDFIVTTGTYIPPRVHLTHARSPVLALTQLLGHSIVKESKGAILQACCCLALTSLPSC